MESFLWKKVIRNICESVRIFWGFSKHRKICDWKNRQNWKRIEKGVTFLGIAVTPAIFVFHRSKTKLNPMKSTRLSVIYVACRALKINDRPI